MSEPIAVTVDVHAGKRTGPYRPLWNWFGYDEPNYTYSANGRKLLRELAELSPEPVRVRTHNLLTTGDGTPALKWGSTNAYTEDAARQPGLRLDDHGPDLRRLCRGGEHPAYPGRLHAGGAVRRSRTLPAQLVARATATRPSSPAGPRRPTTSANGAVSSTPGRATSPSATARDKVVDWPWEVWNEPDGHYWTGTIPEFCAMYDVTAAAIKRALPGARVGGPHTCGASANPKAADLPARVPASPTWRQP